jgi:aminoglycoside phosphotransferase (APT) family kinase protein
MNAPPARSGALLGPASVIERLSTIDVSAVGHLRLQRSWPQGADRLLLEYADRSGERIAGQCHADASAATEIAAGTPGARLLPALNVVLQPHGADRRLPALKRMLSAPNSTLIVHRPERRAVVRLGGKRTTYAKILTPRRAAKAAAAHSLAGSAAGLAVPRLVHADIDAGILEWDQLEGRALADLLTDSHVPQRALARHGAAVARAIAALHAKTVLPDSVTSHDAVAEVATTLEWVEAARAFTGAAFGDAEGEWVDALLASPSLEPVLIHRDLHDGQILLTDERAGLLDLDNVATGEAALDLANLLVHLELRHYLGTPAARVVTTWRAVLGTYEPSTHLLERIAAYAQAARLRVACVHAFRPATALAAARLLRRSAIASAAGPARRT